MYTKQALNEQQQQQISVRRPSPRTVADRDELTNQDRVVIILASWVTSATRDCQRRLGTQPPNPSWGAMLAGGRDYIWEAPWPTFYPGIAIFVTILALNLLGDGLRDVLAPRLKQ